MKRIPRLIGSLTAPLATAAVLGLATATPATSSRSRTSCGSFTLAVMAPITGPAASIGVDQLHWPEFFVSSWNASRSSAFKLAILQGDDQLDPAKASTIAQQFGTSTTPRMTSTGCSRR